MPDASARLDISDLRLGDCLEVMQTMPAASVDAVVTDPPYGLAFMGKHWDHGVPGEDFWAEGLRVAKPGAHMLAFGGTRTFHRLACAIEDAGWELRDTLMWVYGSGFPKSKNLDGDWQGWGTALKPAWEPIILARKPLAGTVAANVQEHGTGALNIDGCRVESGARPWLQPRRREQLDESSSCYGKNFAGSKAVADTTQGRWPANLMHDGSDEVVELFPDAGGGYGASGGSPEGKGIYGKRFPRGNMQPVGYGDTGSAARFFYCAKASKADRDEGLEARGRNNHPTVKPTALMRYLCRLITPPGGVILDPFMGSGSTGKAALREGFRFIGIEKEPEYFEIAKARVVAPLQSDFLLNA